VHEHEKRGSQRIRVNLEITARLDDTLHDELRNTVFCGWLPRCKLNLMIWRICRVQSSVRPVDAVGRDYWP
jgi:hypothetical protein